AGGIQVCGELTAKSRNGSQRTMVMVVSPRISDFRFQISDCDFRLNYFVSAYSASTTSPSLTVEPADEPCEPAEPCEPGELCEPLYSCSAIACDARCSSSIAVVIAPRSSPRAPRET